VIVRGIEVDCGCFGMLADMLGLPDMADMKAVVRNVVFIGLCLLIFFSRKEALSLEGYIRQGGKTVMSADMRYVGAMVWI